MEKYNMPLKICGCLIHGNKNGIKFFIANESPKCGKMFYTHSKMGFPAESRFNTEDEHDYIVFNDADSMHETLCKLKPSNGIYVLTCHNDMAETIAVYSTKHSIYHNHIMEILWEKVDEHKGTILTNTIKEAKVAESALVDSNKRIFFNPAKAINHVLFIMNPILDASTIYNAQRLAEIRAENAMTQNLLNLILAEQNAEIALAEIVDSFDPNIWWNGLTIAEKLRIATSEIKQK